MLNTRSNDDYSDFPWLTAQDVQLLYSIIERAEGAGASETPLRALFEAYDHVLEDHRISKSHDQKYLRFLLRMGHFRKDSVSVGLFDQFQALLARLQIQVDFSGAENNPDEHGGETEETYGESHQVQDEEEVAKFVQSKRRASFESGYETTAERLESTDLKIQLQQRPRSTDLVEYGRSLFVAPAEDVQETKKRKVSFSEVQKGPRAPGLRSWEENFDITSSRSDVDDERESADEDDFTQEAMSTQATDLDGQDEIEMISWAKTLRYRHLMARAVGFFRHWRQATDAAVRFHSHMERKAVIKDSSTLKRQAFDQWHLALRTQHHRKETEKFFVGLEQRASTARDLFLLSKAFTHWAQCTEDEVMRVSTARKHILRTRFFNAWRDITVVNELKVRRLRLSRIVNVWKRRTAQIVQQMEQAQSHYERQAVNLVYQHWFWSFCEHRAPHWYNSRRTRSIFETWLDATRRLKVEESVADAYRQTNSATTVLAVWSKRSSVVQRQQCEADSFRFRRLLLPNVDTLRKELQLVPLHGKIHRNLVSRIARKSLRAWHEKTVAAQRAKRVNELRVMRNAWTTWNDGLRCRMLNHSINERLALQALYKLVVAGRLALFERIRTERLKMQTLAAWSTKSRSTLHTLERTSVLVESSWNRRLASSVLVQWRERTKQILEARERAQMTRDRHVIQHTLETWGRRNQTFNQMCTWADDASFYVHAHTALQNWRVATNASKKTKRREAFVAIRQRVKSALLTSTWQVWQSKVTLSQQLDQQAEQVYQHYLQRFSYTCLTTWHDRTANLAQANAEAYAHNAGRLLQSHFRLITKCQHDLDSFHVQAIEFYTETVNETAASILRDMNWKAFRIRRLEETASSLAERSSKRHYRNMLRYWSQRTKTSQLVNSRNEIDGPDDEGGEEDAASFLGDLRPLQKSFIPRSSTFLRSDRVPSKTMLTTTTPGYLKTPSRLQRSLRVSFTPATPAPVQAPATTSKITPFLNRLQRAQERPMGSAVAGKRVRSAKGDFARRLALIRDEPDRTDTHS